MEAIILKRYKYDLTFHKLLNFFKKEEENIAYRCQYFRDLGEEAEGAKYYVERKQFVLDSEKYLQDLKSKIHVL